MDTALASIKGGQVLEYIRDIVIATATRRRSLLQVSSAIDGTPITRDELAEAQALDAAASIVQFALSAGQEAATRGRDTPEWVMRLTAHARASLTAPED